MDYKLKTFKNGLRLLTVPMPNLESASLTIWVGVGSRYEPKKISGISHFIEHTVFKGTEKRPTAHEVSVALDALGAEANAGTSREWTSFYAKARSGVIESVFDILADVVLNPAFNKEDIEVERGAILEEIAWRNDDPSDKVGDLFMSLVFEGNPLSRDIAGTPKSVKNITRDDLLRYIESHYDAKNIILTVAGKIDEEKVVELAEKYFGNMKGEKEETPEEFGSKQKSPQLKLEYKKSEQGHFYLGFLGHKKTYKHRYAESLLATILGKGFSSRLYSEIREKRGLAYAVGTSVSRYIDTGLFASYVGVKIEKIEEVIKIILDQSYGIRDKKYKIEKDELKKAKEYLKGRMALSLEDTLSVNAFFGQRLMFFDGIDTPDQVFEKIDAVTEDDICRVAKELFVPEKLNLAIIGPYKSDKNFREILKDAT